jgi:hypothetical protein
MGQAMGVAQLGFTAFQMIETVKAGRAEAERLDLETEQDYIATIAAEADRKYEVNKSIASQIAYSADAGGSTATLADEERRIEATDTDRADYMFKLRKRGRRKAAVDAKRSSYISAVGQGISGGVGAAGNLGGGAGALKTGVGTKI